jgi:ABC-type branched-subunit amino acid transport system substrate-binding protein
MKSKAGKPQMDRRRFLKVAGLTVAAANVPLFTRRVSAQSSSIKVAHQIDLTGLLALYSPWQVKALQAAVQRINRAGGIGGREVVLITEDAESKVATGVRVMRKFIERDGADFVIGSHLSGTGLACAPIAQETKTPYFPSGSSTLITGEKGNRYVFRISPSIRQEVRSVHKWAVANLGKRWTTFGVDIAFGQDQALEWGNHVKLAGGTIVEQILIPLGVENMVPYLSRIKPGETEVLQHTLTGALPLSFATQAKGIGLIGKVKMMGSYDSYEGMDVKPFEGDYFVTPYPRRHEDVPSRLKPYDRVLRDAVNMDDEGNEKGTGKIAASAHHYIDWQALYLIKAGIEKSGWKSRKDNPEFIQALEGMRLKGSDAFPQGDALMRAEDHQLFQSMYVEQVRGGRLRVVKEMPLEEGMYPAFVDFRKMSF